MGDHLELALASPGGTGYLWNVEADERTCRVVSRELVADETTFGGTGTARFVVEATHPGTCALRVRLEAPWKDAPAREHEVRISVAGTASRRR